jgi:hypothetical protein
MSDSATTEADGLELSIAVRGTLLHVRLTNRSEEPQRLLFAAAGPAGVHHDHLQASLLGDDGARQLRFTGDRNASTIGIATLEPADHVADDINLAAWALDPINGAEALSPGRYSLTATYAVEQDGVWSGTLTAGPVLLSV